MEGGPERTVQGREVERVRREKGTREGENEIVLVGRDEAKATRNLWARKKVKHYDVSGGQMSFKGTPFKKSRKNSY